MLSYEVETNVMQIERLTAYIEKIKESEEKEKENQED